MFAWLWRAFGWDSGGELPVFIEGEESWEYDERGRTWSYDDRGRTWEYDERGRTFGGGTDP